MQSAASKMPYVRLGTSGLKVSRLILGCMSYGSPEWQKWVLGEEQGLKHIKAAYDAGIQTFDTADVYSNGLSEVILGKAIRAYNLPRDEIVVMTKVVRVRTGHRFDNDTPIGETMQALHDVVQAGYARYLGMSSCHAWQYYAINNKLTPFISMQNHYSLVYREEEREMFPTLKMFGVGAIPWSPLARGFLTRPLGAQTKRGEQDGLVSEYAARQQGSAEIVNRLEELAGKKGISMARLALAWALNRDGVSAPIVGTTSLSNLEDLTGAVELKLSEEDMKFLEEPYKPMAVFGHI